MPLLATSFLVRNYANDADKHNSDVNTLICHNNQLYSGSEDGKIKLWGEDLRLIKTMDAHTRGVKSFAVGNDALYSCSNDGTVKAWSLNDLRGKGTIFNGQDAMSKLMFSDGSLYAGDSEGKVRVFNNDKLSATLNIAESLTDMLVCGNLVYIIRDLERVITIIISYNRPGDNKIIKTIMAQGPMCIAGDKLCCVDGNGKHILVHDNSIGRQFEEDAQARNAHDEAIKALCGSKSGNSTLLYSGGADRIVKQWIVGVNSIEKLNTCNVDMGVNVITAGSRGKIFVGGSDGSIARIDV